MTTAALTELIAAVEGMADIDEMDGDEFHMSSVRLDKAMAAAKDALRGIGPGVMVPSEPTTEIIEAMYEAADEGDDDVPAAMRAIYSAMISAAGNEQGTQEAAPLIVTGTPDRVTGNEQRPEAAQELPASPLHAKINEVTSIRSEPRIPANRLGATSPETAHGKETEAQHPVQSFGHPNADPQEPLDASKRTSDLLASTPAVSAPPVAYILKVRSDGKLREFATLPGYCLHPTESLISERPLIDLAASAAHAAEPVALEKHIKAVGEFLNELYAIMVDPCAEGEVSVADMKAALVKAALRDRDWADLAAPSAGYEAGLREAARICKQGAALMASPMYVTACNEMADAIIAAIPETGEAK